MDAQGCIQLDASLRPEAVLGASYTTTLVLIDWDASPVPTMLRVEEEMGKARNLAAWLRSRCSEQKGTPPTSRWEYPDRRSPNIVPSLHT